MTEQQFAYWLQGFAELNKAPPTQEQWKSIKDHLALVFNKVTPNHERKIDDVPVNWLHESRLKNQVDLSNKNQAIGSQSYHPASEAYC